MSPYNHCLTQANKFGGSPKDYEEINFFIDSSKLHYPFWMHRAITHNSFFIGICEKVFGSHIVNSDNMVVPVRVIAEEHIKEDCDGKVPTIQDWLVAISNKDQLKWMNGPRKEDIELSKKLCNLNKE